MQLSHATALTAFVLLIALAVGYAAADANELPAAPAAASTAAS
jgi:hypothetical protein